MLGAPGSPPSAKGNQGALHMANTITVSTAAELGDALAKATGGETILLEGGDYGLLRMGNYSPIAGKYASTVTIGAADPGNPPSFSKLFLSGVENVTLDGVVFDYDYPEDKVAEVRRRQRAGQVVAMVGGDPGGAADAIALSRETCATSSRTCSGPSPTTWPRSPWPPAAACTRWWPRPPKP